MTSVAALDDPMCTDMSSGGEASSNGVSGTEDAVMADIVDEVQEASKSRKRKSREDKERSKKSQKAAKLTASTSDLQTAKSASTDNGAAKSSALSKPPPFQRIRKNHYVVRKRNNPTFDEIPVCECPQPPPGQMGCLSSCVNRSTHIECTKGYCKCGDLKCSNMRFQNQQYPKLKVIPAGGKGFGVVAMENISEGQFIIEYVGEVIAIDDCAERMENADHFYFLTIDANEGIDASAKGNIARFINHSCDPNCETQKWWVKGETSIGIFAKHAIKKGTELTFDYKFERLGVAKQKCLCGSVNCRGYLGAAPIKNEIEEVRYVFSNHQRHLERLLRHVDLYELEEDIQEERSNPPIVNHKAVGSDSPVFLRRNQRYKDETAVMEKKMMYEMYDERKKVLEQRQEKRRQEIQSSRHYMMGLDIAQLMRQGLVVFDSDAPETSTRRPKRHADNA